MFSISLNEIFIVLFVAILFLNGQDMVKIIKYFKNFKDHWQAFKYQINSLLDNITDKP